MAKQKETDEGGDGIWWLIFIVFAIFYLMNRFGGHVYPWNQ